MIIYNSDKKLSWVYSENLNHRSLSLSLTQKIARTIDILEFILIAVSQ